MDNFITIIILILIIFIVVYFFNKEGFENTENYINNFKMFYLKDVNTNSILLLNNNGNVYFDILNDIQQLKLIEFQELNTGLEGLFFDVTDESEKIN
jgi:hypothetical protein